MSWVPESASSSKRAAVSLRFEFLGAFLGLAVFIEFLFIGATGPSADHSYDGSAIGDDDCVKPALDGSDHREPWLSGDDLYGNLDPFRLPERLSLNKIKPMLDLVGLALGGIELKGHIFTIPQSYRETNRKSMERVCI